MHAPDPGLNPVPTRRFGTALLAVTALLAGALLTPFLQGFFDGPHCATCPPRGDPRLLALPLPFLAAACAVPWAWLFHPGPQAREYGAGRGVAVALLAYLCFAWALSFYLQVALPSRAGGGDRFEAGIFLVLAFVLTPFPWAVMALGALAGSVPLAGARRACARALAAVVRVASWVGTPWRAGAREAGARAAAPGFVPTLTVLVSSALLLAGAAIGFVLAREGPASSGQYDDLGVLVFPASFALILAVVGWAAGRVAVARLPARRRGLLLAASLALAAVAAVGFASRVA